MSQAAGALLLILSTPAAAVTVPGDYPTIQAALDDLMFGSLPSGTLIEVQPGTYFEGVAYANSAKSFTLRGVAGAAATVIDASGAGKPGIKVRDTIGIVRIEGFTVTGASNLVGGGVVFERASPTLADCVVEGNFTSNDGGGVFLGTSDATIENCIIRDNTAGRAGGGVMIVGGSRPLITGSLIEANTSGFSISTGTGGGIQVNDSSPTIRSTVVTGNQALFAGGGIFAIGLFDSPNGTVTLTLEDSEVSANTVTSSGTGSPLAEGGGIHIENNAEAWITRTAIRGNTSDSGGGLNAFRASYEVTDTIIEDNLALAGHGGGVHAFTLSPRVITVNLTRSVVRNNQALNAGGLLVAGATLTLDRVLVDGNTASFQGGGINVEDTMMTVTDSHILRNQVTALAGGAYGGGLRILSATANITGTTIAGNSAGERGGGIFLEGGAHLAMDQSNLYDNSTAASGGGGGLFVGLSGPPTGSIQNSQLADNTDFQIREQSCPPGLPAPILTYRFNSIANEGTAGIYKSPCYPEIYSIAAFNNLSPGIKTVGNDANDPDFVGFAAFPPQAPSVLAWSVPRASTVFVDNLGSQNGPTESSDVEPLCSTTYILDTVQVTVTGTGTIAPPPTCSGQVTLFDEQLGGTQAIEAGQRLDVERVTVLSGADIALRAGEMVYITSPFTVESDAVLQIGTDGCLCE